MKFGYKSIRLLAASVVLTVVSSCSLTQLDINTDPNNPSTASVGLLLPTAEFAIVNSIENLNGSASGFAGQMNVSDDYNMNNGSWNGTWTYFYTAMQNCEEIIRASEKSPVYLGIAQTLKAYGTGMWVDSFGDIPYTDAWKGNAATQITQANFDKDSEIYEKLIKLCDEAIANLAKTSPVAVSGDMFFGGNAASWTRVAKSVKLRLLMNSRKGRASANADIAAAFNAGGLIGSNAQDFQFQYNTLSAPEGRHPWYQGVSGNNFSYLSHQLIGEMALNSDPRMPFYFYRQTDKVLNQSDPTERGQTPYGGSYLPLRRAFWTQWVRAFGKSTKADTAYVAGLFGRDRGDNTGAPLDGALRTAPGDYPAALLYSDRSTTAKALTGGEGKGNGITPIISYANILFYKTEAILDAGLAGDARKEFEAAMRANITKVSSFSVSVDGTAKAATAADIDAYVAKWLGLYDAASSNASKLNVVAKQAWFSYWGQGVESWNLMRRTGYPVSAGFGYLSVGIMNPILRPKRQYALRLPYPSIEGNLNPNAAKYISDVVFDRDPVFWDKTKITWQFP